MPSHTQANRLLKLTSTLGADVLLIESMQGAEGLSRLFDFEIEVLAEAGTKIPASFMGTKLTVEIALLDVQGSRLLNGMVVAFEQGAGDAEFDVYRVHIVPSLWQLTLSSNCRVFQGKTVMDIIKAVLQPYGISMADKTEGTLQCLDYCTQYAETDFNFIARLAEQHGIFYWFEHTDNDNKVVFANSRTPYADCPLVSAIAYSPNAGGIEDRYASVLEDLSATASMTPGKYSTADYDFRSYSVHKVDPRATASPFANNQYERYTYAGWEEGYVKETKKNLSTPNHAKGFNEAQAGANDARALVFHGVSNARSLTAGHTFTVSGHSYQPWNRKYLLTEVVHHIDQVPLYRSVGAGSGRGEYRNRFSAISSDLLYRPPWTTPKPLIHGPQTAIVVGAAGEEIQVDALGRVCVQFFWDRLRQPHTVDNTWVRVAQPWAGSGWGTFFWPRVQDEVIVQFLNGDPDNPIIVGSVYNGVNVPKYKLPDMGTRTGLVTRSSKGGSAANANELRFEDKMGSEQVFLNAEKDMDVRVEHDHRELVGGKDSLIVKGSQLESIGGDHNVSVGNDRVEKIKKKAELTVGTDLNEKVGQNHSLNIGQNEAVKVGMNYAMDAGMEVYIKAGMTLVIESGLELCLKSSGGFITIGPAGIAISGTMVMINSGGAAVSGSAGQLTDPGTPAAPDQADDGTKGGKM